MTLKDRIEEDYKQRFKEGKAVAVSSLRSLKAAIKNAEIDARHDFSDEESVKIVASEVKKIKESLDAFEKAGRAEHVALLKEQLSILMEYMPEQLSDAALQKIITETIAATGAASPQDAGKVMGAVMKQVQGRADGNAVKARVMELLNNA